MQRKWVKSEDWEEEGFPPISKTIQSTTKRIKLTLHEFIGSEFMWTSSRCAPKTNPKMPPKTDFILVCM